MAAHGVTAEEAKRRAELRFQKNAQRENDMKHAAEAQRAATAATAAKIEKLRALRLAREEQDRIAAAGRKAKKTAGAAV
ncbi:hypothetical protein [Ferrovibrio sp.]|uniref:hypothetical protein n=1 Tax=Ferrovibrio sp. TaxID=1917215 RepID=UPI00311EC18D